MLLEVLDSLEILGVLEQLDILELLDKLAWLLSPFTGTPHCEDLLFLLLPGWGLWGLSADSA